VRYGVVEYKARVVTVSAPIEANGSFEGSKRVPGSTGTMRTLKGRFVGVGQMEAIVEDQRCKWTFTLRRLATVP
jgi:hypothetical protein